jgi:DNA topoisomerase-1
MASLLAGMDPETVGLDDAVKLLALPITLGQNDKGEDVQSANGRYGPYVKAGTETRSLPKELSPIRVTLQQALELLAQPKPRGRGRQRAAPKAALRTLREKTEEQPALRVMDGRFGPYVTDGELNASLPKGTTVEELTIDFALELLEERAKKAPRKKKASKKKSAKKKASKKKSAKKKATKKKASKKKS